MIVCVLLVSNSRGCCLAAPGDHEGAMSFVHLGFFENYVVVLILGEWSVLHGNLEMSSIGYINFYLCVLQSVIILFIRGVTRLFLVSHPTNTILRHTYYHYESSSGLVARSTGTYGSIIHIIFVQCNQLSALEWSYCLKNKQIIKIPFYFAWMQMNWWLKTVPYTEI